MSVYCGKADITTRLAHVRFVPGADVDLLPLEPSDAEKAWSESLLDPKIF